MNQLLFSDSAAYQVLGCLMQNPSAIDRYHISDSDFAPSNLCVLVFSVIKNLYRKNIVKIDSYAINDFLRSYPIQYQMFLDNDGINYCTRLSEIAVLDNLDYYIETLKKFSLLRYLEEKGYDVKHIYNYAETDSVLEEKERAKLDSMSIRQIVEYVENELITNSKLLFYSDMVHQGQLAGKGLPELVDRLKKTPEIGLPLHSRYLTTCAMGMRLKKLYIRSSASGGGKSRTALADFCHISIPWYYDTINKKWNYTGLAEPALFISTELEIEEIQTIVLAYVSGVPEDKILHRQYKKGEEERLAQAIEYIQSSSFYVEYLPNFSETDIEALIKRYYHENKVRYICFDYIHMSARLIQGISAEVSSMRNLREDQILFLFVDKLKVLCNTLGVFILTMTQLNGTYKDSPIKDETMLRGAKSLADRVDLGEISLPPTAADLAKVKNIIQKKGFGNKEPNLVRHIYKLRRGKLSKIRVWQYVDFGTARTEDLFVTNFDYKYIPMEGFEDSILQLEKVIEQNSIESSSVDPIETEGQLIAQEEPDTHSQTETTTLSEELSNDEDLSVQRTRIAW